MPRRRSKSSAPILLIALVLVGVAGLLFGAGELWRATRSDDGRLWLAARLGWGEEAEVTRIVSHRLHLALAAAAVPRDSLQEGVGGADARAGLTWRVGLPPSGSPLQLNAAVSQALEPGGVQVLEGRETAGPGGRIVVTLLIGLPRRPTHELVIVRAPRVEDAPPSREPARVALVLYGFGDDPAHADGFFSLPVPFAVAWVPGAPWSGAMLRAARAQQRELVAHLPLEPVNYPQVDPGPGTLLVTMPPARITGTVRRWLDQCGPVTAVANHMGSLATQDMAVVSAVYRELKRRGVPFIHLQPAAGSVCRALASDEGVLYEEPDAVLDAEARAKDTKALDKRWKDVLEQARKRGHAVVFVRATPTVKRWLPAAMSGRRIEGIRLVPLASLVRRSPGA